MGGFHIINGDSLMVGRKTLTFPNSMLRHFILESLSQAICGGMLLSPERVISNNRVMGDRVGMLSSEMKLLSPKEWLYRKNREARRWNLEATFCWQID